MTADGLECTQCGSSCDLQETSVICAECGSLRDLRYDLKRVDQSLNPGSLAERDRGVWRYRDLLPVQQAENIVSLGEGWTPIVRSGAYAEAFGFQNLYLKLDYPNPTGSFKDRGSTVLISKARELGVKSVVDDSSGSAGSSVAAYSARSGITCSINVPDGVRSGKTVQMGMYGASVIRVDGPRGSVVKAAQEACETEGGILRVAWRQCLLLRGHQDGRL